MTIPRISPILLATAFALTGCGGGGGGVASLPPPPVTPPPPPPAAPFVLVPAATTSQQFAVAGSSHLTAGDGTPRLGAADQLQVRYVASSNSYEVELPDSQTWIPLTRRSESEAAGGGVTVLVPRPNYQYSTLIEWYGDNSLAGVEGLGIATASGGVPVTGSATYTAYAEGVTSEKTSSQLINPQVLGTMTLNFNFAQGSLSGNLSMVLDPEWHDYQLGPLNFTQTVYSTGSTTFSGKFDTDLAGLNKFSGLFTGPHAEELIGNFALPYQSPIDSHTYQADGAFVGKRP
jgi:hypothetical protein